MKRIYLILVFFLICFCTSCSCKPLKNDFVVKENGIDITIDNTYKSYFLNEQLVTSIHFDYEGVRISTYSTPSKVIFVQNDQIELSDKFANFINSFNEEQKIITRSVVKERETKTAKIGKKQFNLDEGTKSLEEIMIITLNDGSRLSCSYRTFVSEGKRYYTYTYSENMMISLEQPLMVIKENDKKNIVLLPLPSNTKYLVSGTNTDKSSLIDKDTYVFDSSKDCYYFCYPSYWTNETTNEEELIQLTKDWYAKYCFGIDKDEYMEITYLGINFKVFFHQTKLNMDTKKTEPAFRIEYVSNK